MFWLVFKQCCFEYFILQYCYLRIVEFGNVNFLKRLFFLVYFIFFEQIYFIIVIIQNVLVYNVNNVI